MRAPSLLVLLLLLAAPSLAQTGPQDVVFVARDSSGNEQHATPGPNASYLPEGAVRLDGSFIQTAGYNVGTTSRTIAIKTMLNSSISPTGRSNAAQPLYTDASGSTHAQLSVLSNGSVRFAPVSTAHAATLTAPVVFPNSSYYVVVWRFSYDAANAADRWSSLDVDGVTWGNTTPAGPMGASQYGPKYLGASTLTSPQGTFACNCSIDWFREYSRALNDSEVDELVNASAPRGGLTVEYLFDEAWDYGPPVPALATSATNLTLHVNASPSTSPWPNGSLTYEWDWGDGSGLGTNATDSHRYREEGTYAVTLRVTDAASGANTTLTTLVYVPRSGVTTLETAFDSYIPVVLWGGLLIFCLWLAGDRITAWFPAAMALMNLMNSLLEPNYYGLPASIMFFSIAIVVHALIATIHDRAPTRKESS